MEDTLANLNEAQQKAVEHFKGPILVLAGAGSGKTRVLTRRIAHLILKHHVHPEQILAVTFTNKATEEMRERLKDMLGDRATNLWVSTFHSACLKILRRSATELGYLNDFVVYDDQDSRGVMKQVLKDCSVDDKKFPIQGFTKAFDQAKNSVITPDEFYRWASGKTSSWKGHGTEGLSVRGEAIEYQLKLQTEVYGFYQKALMRANAMDFGDLLMNAVLLLEGNPEIRAFYQRRLQFVLVDEFQDTNEAQYRFIRLISDTHRNLLVVGDDDQSIYAFRGATIRNILEFEKDYENTTVVTLDRNYRSTGNILEAAYGVIRHNKSRKEKKLWTDAEPGSTLKLFVGADEMEEAQFIADQVSTFRTNGGSLKDVAIFYRTNAQSRVLEESFINAGIPYRIFGGLRFYDRKEIRDILAYLRLLVNVSDDQAFLRVINTPPRGIGNQALDSMQKHARQQKVPLLEAARELSRSNKKIAAFVQLFDHLHQKSTEAPLSELIREVIERSGYRAKLKETHDATAESRLENLMELEAIGRAASGAGETPSESLRMFLDKIALTSSAELPKGDGTLGSDKEKEDPANSVSFMTLHLAKGLEFPMVFLVGCEEGLLPHYRSLYDPTELEEERRLCYVGITRAMRDLYLTRAITRGMFAMGDSGGGLYREPSRFLNDIPLELQEQLGFNRDAWDSSEEWDDGVDVDSTLGEESIGEEVWDKE